MGDLKIEIRRFKMNDKTQEQRDAEAKESVNAMRSAQKHMSAALDRIAMLEKALSQAAQDLDWCRSKMPRDAYVFEGKTRLEDRVAEFAAKARRGL